MHSHTFVCLCLYTYNIDSTSRSLHKQLILLVSCIPWCPILSHSLPIESSALQTVITLLVKFLNHQVKGEHSKVIEFMLIYTKDRFSSSFKDLPVY